MSVVSGVHHGNMYESLGQAKQLRAGAQSFRQEMQDLTTALQSGDLSSAQTAYSSLQASLQQFQSSPLYQKLENSGKVSGAMATDFSAIGTALTAGDITGAQSAAQQMQTDMQAQAQQTQKKLHMAYMGYLMNNSSNSQDTTGSNTQPVNVAV